MYTLAIILAIIGVLLCFIGLADGFDPKGGNSRIFYLALVGLVLIVVSLAWLAWMIYRDFLSGLPFFNF